ncbi:hypothetical protein MTBGP_21230 [Moorella thermoacetica]|uniref:thiamine pyrophosphate-dependent enzyme n=1 Tax=Neomoorella thermoacetica TaxID=1525 RepID=UPI0030CAE76E
MEKVILTGNEAVALGAWEAGVGLGIGYPGTPSTEILEALNGYEGPEVSWAVNEKVALEEAYGASLGGWRSLVTMKHVGLNVASDPLFTAAYLGVNGGLVIAVADDPGMHSSQNEQDNRWYALHAKVPMLEPADSTECRAYTSLAFTLSEVHDMPVLLRLVTRVSHSRGLVNRRETQVYNRAERPYERNLQKYVSLPAHCRVRRQDLERNLQSLMADDRARKLNIMEITNPEIGIITSGASYNYVKEIYGDRYSILKLGLVYPLDEEIIREFASRVNKLLVVEELDPYLELHIKSMGIPCEGKKYIPAMYELNPQIIAQSLKKAGLQPQREDAPVVDNPVTDLPPRPPLLCAGCPHRGFFYMAAREKINLTGDIGCYTLGAMPPLNAIETCVCMGGGFTVGTGLSLSLSGANKVFGVLGDSTFYHSGMTGALEAVYNKRNLVPVILDNQITAMTGHQENPGTGHMLNGTPTIAQDVARILQAFGYEQVFNVNAYNLQEIHEAIKQAREAKGQVAIVVKGPCRLLKGVEKGATRFIDTEKCKDCRLCLRLGCPAIYLVQGRHPGINKEMCVGCGLCDQVCHHGAITSNLVKEGER